MKEPMFKVNLNECEDLKCPGCGSIYFGDINRFKIIPSLISPSGKEEVIVIRVQQCVTCGLIIDGFKGEEPSNGGIVC